MTKGAITVSSIYASQQMHDQQKTSTISQSPANAITVSTRFNPAGATPLESLAIAETLEPSKTGMDCLV